MCDIVTPGPHNSRGGARSLRGENEKYSTHVAQYSSSIIALSDALKTMFFHLGCRERMVSSLMRVPGEVGMRRPSITDNAAGTAGGLQPHQRNAAAARDAMVVAATVAAKAGYVVDDAARRASEAEAAGVPYTGPPAVVVVQHSPSSSTRAVGFRDPPPGVRARRPRRSACVRSCVCVFVCVLVYGSELLPCSSSSSSSSALRELRANKLTC